MKIFSCALYLLVSLLSFHNTMIAADTNWQVLSDLNDQQRREFLINKGREQFKRSENSQPYVLEDYYYSNQWMAGFGRSITYVGSIENDFLNYIQQNDSADRIVLFPGCGYGRSVLDALAKTKNTFMIANDLSETGLDKLAEAQKKWFPDAANRLTIKQGNIFDIISKLEDESVDTVFCTHLIHFFNPIEIENFFYQLNRVLKKNGTIFLAWEGFANAFEYQDLQSEFKDFYRIINKLNKANNPYPTYLNRADLQKDLEIIEYNRLPLPHNFITLAEVLEISSAHGFTCPGYKLFKPIMSSLGSLP